VHLKKNKPGIACLFFSFASLSPHKASRYSTNQPLAINKHN
jgi:hypothetical protein